eukprot:6596156-Alexandrium_andersonii.AAC.1
MIAPALAERVLWLDLQGTAHVRVCVCARARARLPMDIFDFWCSHAWQPQAVWNCMARLGRAGLEGSGWVALGIETAR